MFNTETVGEFGDEILERLKEVYSKQKLKYPIHDPEFLRCYQKTVELRNLLFFKNTELVGYVPYSEERHAVIKFRTLYLPIQVIGESYLDLFELMLRNTLKLDTINTFHFNFTDTYRNLETRILVNCGCLRKEFVTHLNCGGGISKGARRYAKKSIDLGCYIDSELNRESFKEYYDNCMYESRKRKGVETKGNPVKLYEFYKNLIELDRGKMLFVRDKDNSLLSGIFIAYSDKICIYLHGATSDQGLRKYAGYLNHSEAIEFCEHRSLIYDLFGTYKNADRNYQNLYEFKRKWGEEFDVAQYIYYPLYTRIAKKMLEALRRSGERRKLWHLTKV